jgi:hypothetical protein
LLTDPYYNRSSCRAREIFTISAVVVIFLFMAKVSDLSDEELLAEAGRRRAAMRTTFSGGRPPSCNCGVCAKCKKREAMRAYRAGLKKPKAKRGKK